MNSRRLTPCEVRYSPAGESSLMAPAGLMWSVVTESPSLASTRAPEMSVTGSGSRVMPSKYGGLRTYVDSGSHSKMSPSGVGSDRHVSSPANTLAYSRVNISLASADATTSWISCGVGQISLRYTGWPDGSVPSGSRVMSTSMLPASAYATTSGGEAR